LASSAVAQLTVYSDSFPEAASSNAWSIADMRRTSSESSRRQLKASRAITPLLAAVTDARLFVLNLWRMFTRIAL
jgi:hypothetical protein